MRSSGLYFTGSFILLSVVTFMFIFAFKLPLIHNSAVLAALITLLVMICNQKILNTSIKLFRKKYFLNISFFYLIIFCCVIIAPFLNHTFDFSFAKSLINGFISLCVTVVLASMLHVLLKGRKGGAVEVLVAVFFMQVAIILVMMFSPEIREIIQTTFQSEAQRERMEKYGGIRGLGLSNSVAFGLSISLGLLMLILSKWLRDANFSMFFKVLLFLICSLISLSTGRTAILGVVAGLFLIAAGSRLGSFVRVILSIFFIVSALLLLTLIFPMPEYVEDLVFKYSYYVFQSFINYANGGSFSVSSIDSLEKMYFIPPSDNFFFGDGKYTEDDGLYYLQTDAGYMRFYLYFGIIGSFLMYSAFSYVVLAPLLNYRKHRNNAMFLVIVFVTTFIYHYKGEVIFYGVAYMKIIFLYQFCYLKERDL